MSEPAAIDSLTFEQALAELEQIVARLESGQAPLEDSIRMYQRLVELHKKDFWISLYPMERHGFVHPDSWYDEYRRIDELFARYVQPAGGK